MDFWPIAICSIFMLSLANVEAEKHLILVSMPYDPYYKNYVNDIAKFANDLASIAAGDDEVVVLYPQQWRSGSDKRNFNLSSARCIYTNEEIDLWTRDFGFVNPNRPVKFKFEPKGYLSKAYAKFVDSSFRKFLSSRGVTGFVSNDLLTVDGGNVVDNHYGKAVVSERFFKNSNSSSLKTRQDLVRSLEQSLNATIAFVPDPLDTTGHADGMVSFIEPDTLLIGDYNDQSFFTEVKRMINKTFPDIKTVRMPCPDSNISDWHGRSAVGVYVNILYTDSSVYVPAFNKPASDREAVQIVKAHVTRERKVKTIDTARLSLQGGSVRCMTMQFTWSNPIAQKLYKESVPCRNVTSKMTAFWSALFIIWSVFYRLILS
ncbi:uncharacterized protein LOC135690435 [Rhopilema esculentum]|uniref:uncharacterized protein LOC135690435 n=1 Tax=Rhopilema esculentum TaxID=499914 RepID=UPI0031D63644|eukprot:gene3681-14944_t